MIPQFLQRQLCQKWRRETSSLQVNYEEKMYAAGKFPGGWMKREGRPSTDATLTARLIDRPIRPMFAEGFRNEVQVINTVLSYDPDASAPMAAMFGSSLALAISDIPFNGPIAGVQVGYVNGELIINPDQAQQEASLLELTVAGNKDAINMVESGAKELSEEVMLEALLKGHAAIQELLDFQNQIVAAVGKEKADVELLQVDPELQAEIVAAYNDDLKKRCRLKKNWPVKMRPMPFARLSLQLTKKNTLSTKNLTVSCVMSMKSWNSWSIQKFVV